MALKGKSVLVTGAGSGIGRATAVLAAEQGAAVALMGRRADALNETADLMRAAGGEKILVAPADLTKAADVDRAVTEALDYLGGVDGLVNNAGLGRFAPIGQADLGDLQFMLDLHLRGPVQLIQRCLPSLRERRGSIVNVTSVAGRLAAPNRSFYGASKAAINHLTRSLAIELAPDVRVNAILPGPVDTPIYDDMGLSEAASEQLRRDMVRLTPMGRFGQPDEVAVWVCHLLDDNAGAWVTGVLLPIDGGRCA